MSDYNNKIKSELISRIDNINDISILELGVQKGISTNYFLEICDKNNGKLYSVDIENCSEVSINPRWKFIHSRDDDFNKIFKLIPNLVDVIYIDSLHEAHHVEKLIYNYYTKLKDGGYIFIDDISHLPYLKNNPRNNFYCEINNKETFEKILEIYNNNRNLFDLSFSFKSSGLAIIKKISNLPLLKNEVIVTRNFSFKNIARLIWKKIKKS
ncbi:class I SAM-dependent methyltransferase [Candidatus Pelagibacter sp.]|nr:class I SAM-dependent methyltransferase [Candidatus Pelagibacter sp.]